MTEIKLKLTKEQKATLQQLFRGLHINNCHGLGWFTAYGTDKNMEAPTRAEIRAKNKKEVQGVVDAIVTQLHSN